MWTLSYAQFLDQKMKTFVKLAKLFAGTPLIKLIQDLNYLN